MNGSKVSRFRWSIKKKAMSFAIQLDLIKMKFCRPRSTYDFASSTLIFLTPGL